MTVTKLLKKRLDVHVCELPKTSQSNLPKLPPNASFHARWKRKFQKWILVSENHPLTRNTLRSYAAIAFEKRRHGRSSKWWIIHPCSDLRFYWDIVMTLTYLYTFTSVPYILSFLRIGKSTSAQTWDRIFPAYTICVIDICLNFITGFTSPEGHEIFLDPILIIKHYVKSFFIFDLISSLPLVWFYHYTISPPGPGANSIFLIPELLPMLKMVRIVSLRVYLRQITASFTISHASDKALWIVVLMMLIFHWCCCLTHACPIVFAHMDGTTIEDSELFLVAAEVYKKTQAEIYLQYFHMGISNFFGSSFIELYILKTKDVAIRCTLLLLGKGCLIYIIVLMLQLAKSAAEPELKYQRIMYKVREYIHERKLPDRLKNKLLAYYEYRFQGSFFKEKAISSTLSNHLYQEIMIHSSRGLLDTATLLHYLPRNIIGNLMGILKPVIYLNEDIIYESESEGEDMFFIVSGTVALITFEGKEICHEKDGGFFGESALIFPDRRKMESAMAIELCELLRLNRRDFKRMFSSSSTFYKRLEKIARERQERIMIINSIQKAFPGRSRSSEGTSENTDTRGGRGDEERGGDGMNETDNETENDMN